MVNRRTFLFLSLGPLTACRAFARIEPADLLRSGPMLGYSEVNETVVWLQTWRPCRAQVRYRAAHTRSLPEMQALLGATHSYAT